MATDLTVVLDDRAGQLAHMGEALGDAGVNMRAVYLATNNRAVAVTDDNAKALAALGM